MPAKILELSAPNGFHDFYCFICGVSVFTDGDGVNEALCRHVMVFVDWAGEPSLGPDAPGELSRKLEEIDVTDPAELAELFAEDTMVIELHEPGRGAGHDGSVCLVALVFGLGEEDE